jgi:Flp pilus assembly pilin Flp
VNLVRRFIREEEGQNVVEYALVLTLIAVAAIAGLTLAGSGINNWWSKIGNYVQGLANTVP